MSTKAFLSVIACLVLLSERCLHAAPPQLRVMSYNIHHGEGTDAKFDLERIAKIIVDSKVDVVALQEVDVKTQRASGVDQATKLGELTKLTPAFGAAMPFSGGEYGGAILSRWPVKIRKMHQLPQESGREPRIAIESVITPDNGLPEFVFVSTHFCHQSEATRAKQAAKLNELLPAKEGPPIVLAGDFNATYNSDTLKTLRAARWQDTATHANVIDYIFTRAGDPWRVLETKTLDEPLASDHLPILSVLEWTK